MKKVLIIGCPGAGKSTFAKILAKRTGLSLYHLDLIWFHGDGTVEDRKIFDEKLQEILEKDNWIIDGYYPRTLERRLQFADAVFFFDLPAEVCLEGANKRIGTKRDDNPVYETELSETLKERILYFSIFNTPYIEDLLREFKGNIIRFQSYHDIDVWFKKNNSFI